MAELPPKLVAPLPAVRLRLVADRAVLATLGLVAADVEAVAARTEEDAAVAVYALSLFRADATSRRSAERRRDIEAIHGRLPRAPWRDEPEAAQRQRLS